MQSSNTHIMRHTCASLLYRNGIDLNTIARILGNSEEVLRKTYVHFDDDNLRRIIDMIEDIEWLFIVYLLRLPDDTVHPGRN